MEDNRPLSERIDDALSSASMLRGAHKSLSYCGREVLPAYGGPKDCYDCNNFDIIEATLNAMQDELTDLHYEMKERDTLE